VKTYCSTSPRIKPEVRYDSLDIGVSRYEQLSGVIQDFAGGSLCEIRELDSLIEKYYCGNIARGHEKLAKEHLWLSMIPSSVLERYPYLFPYTALHTTFTVYQNDNTCHSPQTYLYVQKFERHALSKLILAATINTVEAVAWLETALQLLFDPVYPIRIKTGERNLFKRYHQPRLELAVQSLKKFPRFGPFFEGDTMLG
jgi:hypothetical protein